MRILDLFCGAGGAAVGYHRAGFEVVGVDHTPQPHYPFTFIQGDALEAARFVDVGGFDAIHASPPCQAFTAYKRRPNHVKPSPDLIEPTRALLKSSGLPYVIENVAGAPLHGPVMICGSMFDPPLDVRRHRFFESNVAVTTPAWPCRHKVWGPRYPSATNRRPLSRLTAQIGSWNTPLEAQKRAMGIDWMTLEELSEAIPPAYAEFIGKQLLEQLEMAAA